MPKIHILTAQVSNQIAAGEVVERPSSIVKELVENSIDAGATDIVAEVSKGGQDLIRITDNGCGMDKEDAAMSLLKHATSKIRETDDLARLTTLGFRGEAISSIASVSLFTLRTKTDDALEGTELSVEGGEVKKISAVGCPAGTQVTVKNLFYNTPARRKFLKSDQTEFGHIANMMSQFALSYPAIHFRFSHNGRIVFDLPKADDFQERIAGVLGMDFKNGLLPVYFAHKELSIEGFIGRPETARISRNTQYLFINGRIIFSPYISSAVSSGFSSHIPEKKYPVYVMRISITPELADFNVHPRKSEVRFEKANEVYFAVREAVKKALEKVSLIPNLIKGKSFESAYSSAARPEIVFDGTTQSGKGLDTDSAMTFSKEIAEVTRQFDFDRVEDRPRDVLKAVAQIANSYIVAQSPEGLVIIDQHAAHERILYMKLKDLFTKKEKRRQMLLTPLLLDLSSSEAALMTEKLQVFEESGFEIEHFGGNSFQVRTIPEFFHNADVIMIIKGVLDDLLDEKPVQETDRAEDYVLHYMACRGAIKFGKNLTSSEQQELISQMAETDMRYSCPHGRPTMLKITYEELERRFGRS